MKRIAWTLALALAVTAHAATLTIPSTTVLGTDVFSGPNYTLTAAVQPADLLSLTASGQVFLQNAGTAYGTNPAGVVTTAGSVGVGGTSLNGTTNFGSLLLGNAIVGFHQPFPANAANGLGSASPPSTLAFTNATFSSLGFLSTMPAGTVLQFRISDTNTTDNAGQFSVSGQITTSEIPEPSGWLLMATAATVVSALRRLQSGRRR